MKRVNIHWENTEAERYLREQGGSKAGAHAFLHDTQPNLRTQLPSNSLFIPPGEDPDRALEKISVWSRRKIVRACHRDDLTGMVDVLPSPGWLEGKEAVRAAIQNVLACAQRPEVHSYVNYETGEAFDGQVGILIQDQCEGRRGSIMEHPHERGVFHLSSGVLHYLCDADGRIIAYLNKNGVKQYYNNEHLSPQRKSALELYLKVRDSGLMPDSHSFQMEWGASDTTQHAPAVFFQARLFQPFETVAGFDLERVFDQFSDVHTTQAYHVFGITDPTGTAVMPRAELTRRHGNADRARQFVELHKNESAVAYADFAPEQHEALPLDIQPENIGAYLIYHPGSWMEHSTFRWIQKSPLTLIGYPSIQIGIPRSPSGKYGTGFGMQELHEDVRVQLWSTGIQGALRVVRS